MDCKILLEEQGCCNTAHLMGSSKCAICIMHKLVCSGDYLSDLKRYCVLADLAFELDSDPKEMLIYFQK